MQKESKSSKSKQSASKYGDNVAKQPKSVQDKSHEGILGH